MSNATDRSKKHDNYTSAFSVTVTKYLKMSTLKIREVYLAHRFGE